jgi:hypothetical protein
MIRTQLVFGQALKDNDEFKALWLHIPTEDPEPGAPPP